MSRLLARLSVLIVDLTNRLLRIDSSQSMPDNAEAMRTVVKNSSILVSGVHRLTYSQWSCRKTFYVVPFELFQVSAVVM